MASSLRALLPSRIRYEISRLETDYIEYYHAEIRAWSRDDDDRGRRNVAEYTRRLERAQGRLARLKALLEGKRG